jgi:hypothetical protein
MIIKVTQEDIDKGCERSISNCPIARAAARELGISDTEISVNGFHINIWVENALNIEGSKPIKTAKLPQKARNFITKFDSGMIPPPFEFEAEFKDYE